MIASRTLRAAVESARDLPQPPGATYRLQFHAGFTFRDARSLVPYLASLGVTHLYASPYLRARGGSAHGYDVADPNALNPELGSEDDFEELVAELRLHGMGHVLDIVPNHMGIGDPGNTWWLDVLENGPSSIYADFFDVDWDPLSAQAEERDRHRLILPVLGDQYGRVLENGELRLGYGEGAFHLDYYDQRRPISPRSYALVLAPVVDELESELGADDEQVLELQSIVTAQRNLPEQGDLDPRRIRERNREKEVVKRRLDRLYQDCPPLRGSLDRALERLNGRTGDPRSFDELDHLLDRQAYRLAFWRVAAEEINYRRFFDVSELAAVRMEDPRVFEHTHRLLLRLVEAGLLDGLRIDHPDGLWDPNSYLWRLQRAGFIRLHLARLRAAGAASEGVEQRLESLFERLRGEDPDSPLLRPIYVVVEKILSGGEALPSAWPVAGTTGYDFLNLVNGLLVEREHREAFDALYARFSGSNARYPDVVNSSKKLVMLIALASEVNQLAHLLKRLAARSRRHRDFTLNGLTFAIREVVASLPVYRTYVDPESGSFGPEDAAAIEAAVADARRRNPRTDPSLFQFVRDVLLQRPLGDGSEAAVREQRRFTARFQQTSGPVMAKGAEDTAFYIYNRLVSLNEVGGDPGRFGVSVADFHRQNQVRRRRWPRALLATSTHDTKRSEDVRARIAVLSELPREWNAALVRWSRLNGVHKRTVDGRPAPDRNDEYLLYQTLLGAWPPGEPDAEELARFRERIQAFWLKALKEAKVHTSWITQNRPYEDAAHDFVTALLDTSRPNPFLHDFRPVAARVAYFGLFNALSQALLKLTAPGVPDIYQGNELWDFSLVDPDNRRPVDFERRRRALDELRSRMDARETDPLELARELVERREDGRIKLYVTLRALELRRHCQDRFTAGAYQPLRAAGAQRKHVCAFSRGEHSGRVLVVAPLQPVGLTGGVERPPLGAAVWTDTWLALPGSPGEEYRNVFTGEHLLVRQQQGRTGLPLSELLGHFPLAVLERE